MLERFQKKEKKKEKKKREKKSHQKLKIIDKPYISDILPI
jgi:hypothetical protein